MTHVAITGASSGIGASLVSEFVRAGAAVTLVSRRQAEMEALAARVGGQTQIFAMDLCDVPRCCDWLAPAAARFGPIDVLINNAGMQIVEPTIDCDIAQIEAMMALNLTTPMRLSLAVLPEMLARGGGTIVDVSSLAAMAGLPGMWGYNASKAGIAAASESLRGELRGSGVHIITVYPGPVDTPMARAAYTTYPPWARSLLPVGDADELARRVRTAVELKSDRIVYPSIFHLPRYFPTISRWVIDRVAPRPGSKKSIAPASEK